MSGGVHMGKGSQANHNLLYGDPPNPAYGPEVYINQLYAQAGMPPSDKFEPANANNGGQNKGSILSSITKWAGLAFAGVLAFLGLKRLLR